MNRSPKPLTIVPPAVFKATLEANRRRAWAERTGNRMRTTTYLESLPPIFSRTSFDPFDGFPYSRV